MKITLISLVAFTALTVAPVTSHAIDKEVIKARHVNHARQLAFTGHDRSLPRMQTVTQVGQGQSVTFYTGQR